MPQISQEMRQCIDECLACYSICVEATAHGLEQGGKKADATFIRMMTDCAEVCRTNAGVLLRGSNNRALCGICADLCEQCAKMCDQFGDDPVMKHCADACRRCADICRKMAA